MVSLYANWKYDMKVAIIQKKEASKKLHYMCENTDLLGVTVGPSVASTANLTSLI